MCVCVKNSRDSFPTYEVEKYISGVNHVITGLVVRSNEQRERGKVCVERARVLRVKPCAIRERCLVFFFLFFFFVCYILKKIYPRAMRPKRLGSFFLNSRSAGSLSLVLTLNVTSYFFPFFFFFFSSLLIRMYNLYVYIFVYIYVRVYRERKRVKNEPRPSRAGNERTNAMQRREKGKVKIGDGRELLFFVFFPFPFFSFLFFRLKSRVFRDRTDFSFYLSPFFLYRLTV